MELGDVLLVPVNGEENFKTATVLMTFEMLNDKSLDDFDLSQVEHVVEKIQKRETCSVEFGQNQWRVLS